MKIDIAHFSKLANLPLKLKEQQNFEKQLSDVLENFKKLKEVATEKIEETSQVTGLTNVARVDKVTTSLSQDEAVMNSKNVHNGLFVVAVILEEGIGG